MWWLWWLALAALGAPARARARLVCARDQTWDCYVPENNDFNYRFLAMGYEFTYKLSDGNYFALDCPSGIAFDESALPHFETAPRVREVRFSHCWPRARSYPAILRALNVTALGDPGGGGGPATPTYPTHLQLNYIKNYNASVLADMPALRNLRLHYTSVTAADLALLPVDLERLELRYTRIGRVPATALARLPRLSILVVEDDRPVEVEPAGTLRWLHIESPATLVGLSLPDSLSSLELMKWAKRQPAPWHSCAGLDRLAAEDAIVEALPDGWLARCARLRSLELLNAKKLKTLAAGALRGATALEVVWIMGGALETLPAGLLDEAPALRVLDLHGNRLHTLPGKSKSLEELSLSRNSLSGSVLGALEAITSLSVLRLSDNIALDPCPRVRGAGHDEQGLSPLRDLKNLTKLFLARTSTWRVCADWRQLPRLKRLELHSTSIAQLNYTDLQFNTTVDIYVVVLGVGLYLRREDYERVAAAPAGPTLTVELAGMPRCDCELYWAAAALRHPNRRLRVAGWHYCADGRKQRDVPLDELVCPAPGACPAGCACGAREDSARPGRVLRLDCAGAGLRRVPRVDARAALLAPGAEPVALDLRLARNDIDRLDPEDAPPNLVALDLRNNSLRLLEAAAAAALVSRADRRVWLAGNPLECGCRAAAALAAVRDHPAVFRDLADAACSDGTPLAAAEPLPCGAGTTSGPEHVTKSEPNGTTEGLLRYTATPPDDVSGDEGSALTLALGALLALGAVAVAAVAWVAVRRRRRAARRARLPATLRLERIDAGEWVYDAFVSFAHADETVVRELMERLEGGAAPLRLCVHYRDWVPGGWIPALIAESVRVSRRTVAVVSEAFLRSKWARAEFREACAAALEDGEPRLVLVLLEDPSRLPLDAELRAYVSNNTYVRWGDPWFWEKLQRALPAPIAPTVSESPTTAPPGPSLGPPAVPPGPSPGPPAAPPGPLPGPPAAPPDPSPGPPAAPPGPSLGPPAAPPSPPSGLPAAPPPGLPAAPPSPPPGPPAEPPSPPPWPT